MKLEEVGVLFDQIIEFYPMFAGDENKLINWHKALADLPFHLAEKNLLLYASNPDNKFPPHPGALAKRTEKTENERYHDQMRVSGTTMLNELDQLRKNVAPPSEEQRRRVRELLGK